MFCNHSSTGWHFTCWMALPIYPVKNCAETNNTELEYKNHMLAACSNHYSVEKWKKNSTTKLSSVYYILISFGKTLKQEGTECKQNYHKGDTNSHSKPSEIISCIE